MTSYDSLLQTAFVAVDQAKEIFLKPVEHQLTGKGDRDYATEADYEIERVVRKQLAEATPDIGFLGEEEGHTGNTERYWCLDPIDGTVNYSKGLPLCGISLALVEDDQPNVGVIDLPFLGNRYAATIGQGAFRDGQQVHVGSESRLHDAVVSFGDFAVGNNADFRNELRRNLFDYLAANALRVRMLGSAVVDLAWVADGKTDIAVIVGGDIWDTAAGIAIVREAGANVKTAELAGQSVTIAANDLLLGAVTDLLVGTTR